MTQIESLLDLIERTGARTRLFDMGRRVGKLSTETFAKVEQGLVPYPRPYLHHAWIGLLLWDPENRAQNAIWFLKLPLDEQGYLVQAARDDLLKRLLQNVDTGFGSGDDALKDNPFSFKPDDEKMAIFHAYAGRVLQRPASRHYEYAQHYFAGQLGFEQWPNLGYQGIADLVLRLDRDGNEALLTGAIDALPDEPLRALCRALEHVEPGHRLIAALQPRFEQALQTPGPDDGLLAALVRAVSNSPSETLKRDWLAKVLASPRAREAEVIVAVATRCCDSLAEPVLLRPFLEQLAAGEAGQAGFSRVLADLMFMPALRTPIMAELRNPERSETLTRAIGDMFGQGFRG